MTQERAVRTREQMLVAAAEEFVAHGYLGTRLQDVVQRAGMTKGAFYGHFSSKAELAATLVDEAGSELVARVKQWVDPGTLTADVLRTMILDLARYLRTSVKARSALRLAREVSQSDTCTVGLAEQILRLITLAAVEAQKSMSIDATRSPETIAKLLMSIFLGIPEPLPQDDGEAARRFDELWAVMAGPPADDISSMNGCLDRPGREH